MSMRKTTLAPGQLFTLKKLPGQGGLSGVVQNVIFQISISKDLLMALPPRIWIV